MHQQDGIRPVVCLKSNVKLEKQADGDYVIIENNTNSSKIEVENKTWQKSHSVELEITDELSGLAEGASLQYAWSESSEEEPTSWNDVAITSYTAGGASTTATIIGSGLNGKYHLWIKATTVDDLVGNSNTRKAVTGEFWFDNIAPTIAIEPEQNETWAKEHSAIVTIADNLSGVEAGAALQYGWSESNTKAPTEWADATISEYTAGATNVGFTAQGTGLTGKYYLWVKPTELKDISVEGGNSQTASKVSVGTFWFDNTAPTVTITSNPTSPTNASSITYTFTFNENVTGFEANDIIVTNGTKGEFTGSGTTYTLEVTNAGTCIQTVTIADGICIDVAENENIGASITVEIDRTEPTVEFEPNGNTTPEQSQTTTVTVIDPVSDVQPSVGLNTSSLKYVWTETTEEPADSEFATSFTNGQEITLDGIETGGRYLWIMAVDNLGNTTKVVSNVFNFDNILPTISVNPDKLTTAAEKLNVTITVEDNGGAALAVTNEYKYYLSSSQTALEGGEEKTYQSGETKPIGTNLNGTYYLFVKQISDEAGNLSEQNGTTVTINGSTWHRFGEYIFDNTIPEVVFGTNGNTAWAQEHSTTVTLTDAPSGLNESTLKYLWTQSDVAPTNWTNATGFVNGATISTTEEGKDAKSGDNWRLWIYAEDNLGHKLIASTNPFYLDNTAPSKVSTITMKLDSAEGTTNYTNNTWTNHDVYIALNNDGEDAHSGVKTTTYTVNGGTATSEAQTLTATGKYEIVVTTTDNVGLTSSSEIYKINIDKDNPTAPFDTMLIMKQDNNEGANYTNNTWTNHSVYIALNTADVRDEHSGYLSTVYSVSKDGTEIITNKEEATTLTETGTYTITVTTMDKAGESYSEDGNITVNTYTVKIDKVAPIAPLETTLTMKLYNSSGANYTNETWTKHDVYIAKVDGTDEHSGHLETVYSVSKDGTEIITNKKEATTLTETGVYTVTTTTMDKSGESYSEDGNTTVNTYTIKIDQTNPTVGTITMKLDNDLGNAYTSEELTNHDVYISLNDGSDEHSGHLQTTYNVYYMGSNNSTETDITKGSLLHENQTASMTIAETGRYIIVVTTEDKSGETYSESGNKSTQTYIVIIDQDLPTVTATPDSTTNASANDYVKTQKVTLTVAEMGVGLDENNQYQYCLVLDQDLDATFSEENITNAQSVEETKWKTYSSGTAFEIGENKLNGTYYLIVRTVNDKAGNVSTNNTVTIGGTTYHQFGPYKFDNTAPTIQVNNTTNPENGENQNVTKDLNVTLTYNESTFGNEITSAEISDSNIYEYYLSTSNTELTGGNLTTINPAPTGNSYTKTAEINIGARETGTRYLFVRTIVDNLSNESTKTITSNGANYELVGTYIFDNTAPVVSFNPDGETNTWKQEQTTQVTVQDNDGTTPDTGVAGVKTSTIKYRWVKGNSTLTTENFANGEERAYTTRDEVLSTIIEEVSSTEPDETSLTLRKTGDNWYLWIYAEDNLGNKSVTRTTNPFKIDNTLPTISVSPESAEVCKSTAITIIASDLASGLNSSNEYVAYLSTTSTDLVNEIDVSDDYRNSINEPITIGEGITGWRYLFVKTVKDNVDLESEEGQTKGIVTASDGNKYHVYGPYIFDNTAPSVEFYPNGNPTWETSQTTTVTITENPYTVDAATETAGEAGIKKDALKYVWRKAVDGTPTAEQITETLVIEGTSETLDDTKGTTIQIQRPITKNTDSDNDWLLWVYVEDTLGNSQIVSSNPFWLDNTKPTLKATPEASTVVKNTDVTLTLTETHSRLNDTNNSYQYYLSTSDSLLTSEAEGSIYGVPQSLKTYTLEQAKDTDERTAIIQDLGSTETGTRYLFVKAVKDNVGNESIEGGTIKTIDGINYHRFGPYEFDNLEPKTTRFEPESNTTSLQTQTVKVTIEDQGLAGLKAETFKYLWIQSSDITKTDEFDTDSERETKTNAFDTAYETQAHKGTFTNGGTVTINNETGNDWYLWISAEDNFGHRYIDGTGAYYLDNTKPTIEANPNTNPDNSQNQDVVKNIDVTLTYKDPLYEANSQLAGLKDNNSYQYYLSTSDTELLGGTLTTIDPAPTGDSYTKTATINIGSRETGIRYLFVRTVFDNAGNQSEHTLTHGGNNYKLVGTYIFDNTSPKVDFAPNGNSWSKEHSTTVTVREEIVDSVDYGVALVDADTLKYLWIELSEKDTALTEEKFNEQYNSDSITHKGTFETGDTMPLDIETGNWYLWIIAKDNLGNTTVISSDVFNIDNTAPTVGTVALTHTLDNSQTINYDTDTWTKHSVTITLTDGYDGEGESGHADTIYNITGTYKNANGEYVEYVDSRTDKSTTTTLTETGEYEVRVTTTDNVGNSTTTEEGTYIIKIDKENPIVGTITMTYEGTANVYNKEVLTNKSVNIVLNNGSDETYPGDGNVGESGHKRTTYAIYYMGSNNSTEMDTTKGSLYGESARTEPTTIDTTGRYIIVVTTEDMSGDYYSENGNLSIDQTSYIVVIDKDLPTITASPSLTTNSTENANNYVTSQEVTLVVGEVGVGLDNDNNDEYEYDDNFINAYEYALILDSEENYITLSDITSASWTEYTSGTAFTIGQDLTGTYYLVVKTVRDKAGNISSEYGDTDTFDGYHVFGPYKFDNTAPTITTSYSSSEHTEYKQTHIPTVTIVDNNTEVSPDVESGVDNAEAGDLNIDETTLKYVWVNEDNLSDDEKVLSEDAFTREWQKAVTHEATVDSKTGRYVSGLKGTFTEITNYAISSPEDNGTQQITGDNWHIWVIAKDNLGNTQVVKAGPFYLDNTRPTLNTEANPKAETTTSSGTKVWTNADVTITVKETNAGLDDTYNTAESLYQYYLSTSANSLTYETADSRYGVTQSLTNYILGAENEQGERTAKINIGSTETGTRYLFIKAVHDAVADADGNNNVSIEKINNTLEGEYGTLVEIDGIYYHRFGPYEFDNLEPTGANDEEISFNQTANTSWEQYQSVTVTIEDQGQAGLDNGEALDASETTTLKYLWNQSSIEPANFDEAYESAEHKGTFTNGETLTLKDVNGNDWYLWISAYDNLNHRFIDGAGPFYLDNTLPEIAIDNEVNPSNGENQNVVKNLDVKLTFRDPLYNGASMAGLRDGADSGYNYEYYLSTSSSSLTGGTLTEMNPTGNADSKETTINIGSGETGIRYLFVRTVYDEAIDQAGRYNESEELNNNDTLLTDNGKHYQLIGTYIFDNTAPVVSFNPNGETVNWKQEQTTDVTVQDNESAGTSGGISSGDTTASSNFGSGVAGVKTSTIKYRWVQGTSTVLTTDNFANGEERAYTTRNEVLSTITEEVSSTEPDELLKTGDNWYLWIYAEDNLGNKSVTRTTNPFKIDNTLPTISVSPESAEVCKSTAITIIASDLASGLNSSNEYVAYLSTTSTDLVNEIDVSDDYRNSINEPITIGEGITGWRYLFVKTVKDNVDLESEEGQTKGIVTASDGNKYHVYGPYIFDNTAPSVEFEPNGNENWKKEQTTTVTITENPYTVDSATETAGEAGIKKDALKYVWRKASQGEPSKNQITETLVIEGTSETLDDTKGTTIKIQRPITKNTDSDDDWVLWVYVEDTLGNSNIVSSNPFWLDNTNPTLKATPEASTVVKNTDVTLTFTDVHSRLDDTNNSYQYFLSTSDSLLTSEAEGSIYGVPQSLKPYTIKEANNTDTRTALINIGNTETGTRYLFVKAVKDNVGNESIEGGTIKTIDGINYHRFGPYEFDNLSPVVTFEPEFNTTYEQAQSSKVTLTERGTADFNTSTFKYLWTTENVAPTPESFDQAYETQAYKGTYSNGGTVSIDTETGNNWYLWISSEDNLGNRLVERTGTFWLDNTKPTVNIKDGDVKPESEAGNGVWQNANITITVTEEHAKLASDSLFYYLSTSENALTSEQEGSPYGEPQVLNELTLGAENSSFERKATISKLGWNSEDDSKTNETGLRYLFIKAKEDNAGNISSEFGTLVTITSGEYAGTYHRFGPYVFDNAPPQVEFNPDGGDWKQSYNIEVKITEIGEAGIDTNSLKYLWVENSQTPPSLNEFTNSFTAEETVTSDTGIITQTISHIATPVGETGDNWTLWILVKDILGEANVVASQIFKLDNAKPVMMITTGDKPSIEEVCKSTQVTISFNETHAGLAEGTDLGYAEEANSYQYYLSTSSDALENGEWKEYEIGQAKTIGEGITGRRYLFVKTVKDKANNESSLSVSANSNNTDSTTSQTISGTTDTLEVNAVNGTTVTIDGTDYHRFGEITTIGETNYHMFGEFVFDNTEPEIKIEYNEGEHDEYKKSQVTTVTVRDNTDDPTRGEAGVNISTLKYQWNQSSSTPTESSFDTAEHKGTFKTLETDITSPEGETGNDWYLWILAKDNLGNTAIVTTNPFWLDNTKPTISITNSYPENQNIDVSGQIVTRYADVTLVLADQNAGLPQETDPATLYQYYLSTSNTALDGAEWKTYQSGTAFRIGEGITDTRYLFVRQIADNAGNLSEEYGTLTEMAGTDYHLMGTYVFDNTVPDVTIAYDESVHQVYEQSQSVSVTVGDNTVELPNAGINFENSLVKYEWTNENTEPTEFTNTMTSSTQSLITSGYTGYRYLWIYAEDNIGNSTIVSEGPFYLDNTKPVMNKVVTPTSSVGDNVWKSANVTITFTEEHSGMVTGAEKYQYYLSTTSTALQGGTLTNYTAGTEFTIGVGQTGTRYLLVKAVKDEAGNESNLETDLSIVNIDGQNYHVFGPYEFDNSAPTVTFNPDTNTTYQKVHKAEVTVTDVGMAGIAEPFKYLWVQGASTVFTTETEFNTAYNSQAVADYKGEFNNGDEVVTPAGVTGNDFILWVLAKDNLGNTTITHSNEYWLDNTPSELHVTVTSNKTTDENIWKSAEVTLTATDSQAGIDTSKTYKYYLSTSSVAIENAVSGTFILSGDGNTKTATFTPSTIGADLTDQRYLFIENIYDNAGNTTLKEDAQITVNGATTVTTAQTLDSQTVEGATYHVFGDYKFDNSSPAITITITDPDASNPIWSREHTAEVIIVDVGLAGLDTSTFKYVWVNEESLADEQKALSEVTFADRWNDAIAKETADGVDNLYGTFTEANTSITTPTDNGTELISGPDWYLWILAKDKLGNTVVVKSSGVHLDNEIPKFELTPGSGGPAKTIQVLIKAVEGKSGLADQNMRQYYLSTSDTALEGGEWKNYSSQVEETLGTGKTGTYYLYVKQLKDKAGNESNIVGDVVTRQNEDGTEVICQMFGPYIFDNSNPTVEVEPETSTNANASDGKAVSTQDVTITLKDIGHADLDDTNNNYEYFLSSSSEALSDGSWISYKDLLSVKQAGATNNTAEDTRTATITIGTGITGTRYLFIRTISDNARTLDINLNATDTVGNTSVTTGTLKTIDGENYHMFGEYVFDNSGPSVTVTPETTTSDVSDDGKAVVTQDVTITLGDIGTAGLATNDTQYFVSSDNEALVDGEWKDYTSGTAFTIGAGKTGEYYLFVKQVTDNLGHLSITAGELTTIDEVTYHRFGPYIFDNSSPIADEQNVDLKGNTTWKQVHTVTIGLIDIGTAGVGTTFDYLWVQGETEIDEVSEFNTAYGVATGDYKGTCNYGGTFATPGGVTGNDWKVLILAKDKLGNTGVIQSGDFWLDNTKPQITVVPDHADVCREVEVTLSAIEEHSGFKDATYEYYLSGSSTNLVDCGWGGWTEYVSTEGFTIGRDEANGKYITGETWLFLKVLNDNAGNDSDLDTGNVQEIDGVEYHVFGPYIFDNSGPKVTVVPETTTNAVATDGKAVQTQDVEITVEDIGKAGLVNETTPETIYQYYLSSSSVALADGAWTTYTLTQDISATTDKRTGTITIGEDLTGSYYLFIRTVNDILGNESISEGLTTIGEENYHMFGEYVFDNTAPNVEFNPEGGAQWAKSHVTTVTVRDDNSEEPNTGTAGVNETSLKYLWIKGNEVPTEESEFTESFENGQLIARALGTGNDWYLWVLAEDNAGNQTIVTTNPFWLDNTAPILESMTSKPSSPSTYTLTMSGISDTDEVSPQSEVKAYYISTEATLPTADSTSWIEIPDSAITATDETTGMNTYEVIYEGALELTTYYFWTIDNVGNISEVTELTTKEIFYSINNTSWYETFADAVADASTTETDTIYVLKDVTDSSEGTVNKTVKLDANGKTLTRTTPIDVVENGRLEVIGTGIITTDSTTEPTITTNGGILKLTSGTITNAGYQAVIEASTGTAEIAGGTVEGNIYAGNGTVKLTSGTVNGNVHGGKANEVATNSSIILQGTTINGNIYGGGDATEKVDQVNITLISGTVKDVFGGGLNNSSVGTVNIVLNGDVTIESGNIYGGPNVTGTVDNANIDIKSGTLTNVYGGGTQGGTTLNTTVTIEAGATITGNVYGGAHKATIGNEADNSGSVAVNIVGGTIQGNVYGGSDTNPVYGETNINIGKDAVGEATLTSGEITIAGDIFGGGHKDQSVVEDEEDTGTENEEEVKDFTEVSVTNGTHINIDGNGTTINLGGGDIFGSGERTTYEGNASITIANLGSSGNPYLINSIQRTETLTIDNSHLEIIGVSDSSNLNVDASYTLNRIGTLQVQGGTYLYLRRGFNVVGGLNSLASDGSKATVTITDGTVTSKNVDNRIYVYEGVNLFIAKQEYSKTTPISQYGKVNGMTFFGMYTRDRSGDHRLEYDVYAPTNPISNDTFIMDSYVEGLYDESQAITVDGFYTNAVENSSIINKYVTVIASAPTYQDWMLGDEKVYTQEVTLVAQRNKQRVYQSIPLDYLTQQGAEYEVKLFSANSLEPDINLVSKTSIPRVASSTETANTTFALSMKNGSGWQNSGETYFYTSDNPIQGTTVYLSDYSGEAPYLDFYLYNSINITETKDCGYANIVLEVTKTTNGDASEGTKFKIAISVNIQTIGELIEGEFKTDARITDGVNFGLITENEVFITDRSSMTTYFDMYPLGTIEDDDYRVLSSTCELPVGTQLTMVDYGEDEANPKVYYYEVKEGDGIYEEETGRYIYNFSDFILMSSVTEGDNVTTEEAAASYYSNNNVAYQNSGFEEYKILIDFKNATITEDLLEQNIRFELRGSDGYMKNYEILPTQFNIYADKRSELSLNVTKDSSNVYEMIESGELGFIIKSIMTTQSVSINSIITDEDGNTSEETIVYPVNDTYYDDKKLGMAISLYDSEGNKVPYEKVKGIYFVVDGEEYYPDLTGTARWYLSDNVVTVEKTVKMYIEGGLLDSGTYQVRIENFASDNGTYFGNEGDNQDNTTITMIDLTHGLDVDMVDADRVIDAETGKTHAGDNLMNIEITTSDVVSNTNIRVKLYKRDITYNSDLSYAGVSYTLVDLANYVSNTLTSSGQTSEYIVSNSVTEQTLIDFTLNLKENLATGGYKLEFSLYSGDNCLGTVDRHFVVTDLVTVE